MVALYYQSSVLLCVIAYIIVSTRVCVCVCVCVCLFLYRCIVLYGRYTLGHVSEKHVVAKVSSDVDDIHISMSNVS